MGFNWNDSPVKKVADDIRDNSAARYGFGTGTNHWSLETRQGKSYQSRRDTEDWTDDIVQSEGEVWYRIGFCEGKSEEWGVQNVNRCSCFEHFLFLYCSAVVVVALLIIRKLYSALALPGVCRHCFWTTMGCVYTAK